jgi:hypothetical protein
MKKSNVIDVFRAIFPQLLIWVPFVFSYLQIEASKTDIRLLSLFAAAATAGVLWFGMEWRRAAKMADEEGKLPEPQGFWSVVTGRIISRISQRGPDGPILVLVPSDANKEGEFVKAAYSQVYGRGKLVFVRIDEFPLDPTERKAEVKKCLDGQNPLAVVPIDNGSWGKILDVDIAVRAWGARFPDRPILAIQSPQVGDVEGTKPSLHYSSVALPPTTSTAVPFEMMTRLFGQTLNRGELWKESAQRSRYFALSASAVAIIVISLLSAGTIVLRRQQLEHGAELRRARSMIEWYKQALIFPEEAENFYLNGVSVYNDSAHAVDPLMRSTAAAIRAALYNANGQNPRNTNVVLLALFQSGDSTNAIEVARAPADESIRQPFPVGNTGDLDGIAPCAVANKRTIYWRGLARAGQEPQTDSIGAGSAKGGTPGKYDSSNKRLYVNSSSCQYRKLSLTSADDNRRELLCTPVGSTSGLSLPSLGVICVSSNSERSWLAEGRTAEALEAWARWTAPLPWSKAAIIHDSLYRKQARR